MQVNFLTNTFCTSINGVITELHNISLKCLPMDECDDLVLNQIIGSEMDGNKRLTERICNQIQRFIYCQVQSRTLLSFQAHTWTYMD